MAAGIPGLERRQRFLYIMNRVRSVRLPETPENGSGDRVELLEHFHSRRVQAAPAELVAQRAPCARNRDLHKSLGWDRILLSLDLRRGLIVFCVDDRLGDRAHEVEAAE